MQNINIGKSSRQGACARGLAGAGSAWISDQAEKDYVLNSASAQEIEERYYAADSTEALACLVAKWLGVCPEVVLCGFYDETQEICTESAAYVPEDRTATILSLLVAVKAGWSDKNSKKWFDPARMAKRYMHLAATAQPWSNIHADWLFIEPVANHFLHLNLTEEEAKATWTAHLMRIIEEAGGIDGHGFREYVINHSVDYVQESPPEDIEVGYVQLVDLLKKELSF